MCSLYTEGPSFFIRVFLDLCDSGTTSCKSVSTGVAGRPPLLRLGGYRMLSLCLSRELTTTVDFQSKGREAYTHVADVQ